MHFSACESEKEMKWAQTHINQTKTAETSSKCVWRTIFLPSPFRMFVYWIIGAVAGKSASHAMRNTTTTKNVANKMKLVIVEQRKRISLSSPIFPIYSPETSAAVELLWEPKTTFSSGFSGWSIHNRMHPSNVSKHITNTHTTRTWGRATTRTHFPCLLKDTWAALEWFIILYFSYFKKIIHIFLRYNLIYCLSICWLLVDNLIWCWSKSI